MVHFMAPCMVHCALEHLMYHFMVPFGALYGTLDHGTSLSDTFIYVKRSGTLMCGAPRGT